MRNPLGIEHVPRQSVHLPDVAGGTEAVGIHVVRREVIAAPHHQPFQITSFARHTMQRLDTAHHRQHRQQFIVTIHDEFTPRPLHRQRFHRLAVRRQPAVFDQAARFEMRDRVAVRHAIERHRQFEGVRLHAEVGAGERHALGVARQLKVGCRGLERFEPDIPVTQDEHATVLHTTMHAPGHLQDLVRAEMHAREHIAAAVDHVGEAGVVDDDGIEPRHIQRALPGRRHREEERLRDHAFEKWTDYANRLAAVIVSGRNARVAQPHPLGGLFHRGARGQEHRHTSLRAGHLLQELVVEKIQRLLALDFDLGGLGGIERRHLQHIGAFEIARIKRGIDRRRQPDIPASHALPEREAELELRAGLVDFIDDQRVRGLNVAVLKPASCDAGRDDHDVPRRRFGRRFTFAVHDPRLQDRRAENRFGDWTDRERFAGPGARHDTEAVTTRRQTSQIVAARPLEERIEVQADGEFDRLAGRAGGRDDDDAPSGRLGRDKGVAVGG